MSAGDVPFFLFPHNTSKALQRGDKSLIGIKMCIGIVSPVIHIIDRDCA